MHAQGRKPVPLIYVYASQDQALRDQLDRHLEGLRQRGLIHTWFDRQIVPGTDWRRTISAQIQQASIILLLISADFIASDYSFGREMRQALTQQAEGKTLIIPVLLRPVDWQAAPFAHLQSLPRNGKPVTQWAKRDDAFAAIAEGIKEAVSHLQIPSFASCFIAYAHENEAFAERLSMDLRQHHIACWYAPVDLAIGSNMRQAIEDAIFQHDKLVLILSEQSIASAWVEQEVETVFEIERTTKRSVLFPIRLDEAVMQTQHAWAATIRRMRLIGDFRRWQNDISYQQALQRLLRDLHR